MASAGRKRKQGKRTKSGRLTQEGRPRLKLVAGNDIAEAKKARFGQNGYDAIGRAFECGLLGEDAQLLLDTARAVSAAYWRAYQVGPIRCAVNDPMARHGASEGNPEQDHKREQWLMRCLDMVAGARTEFDQLVIDMNPDFGPSWLDALLADRRADRSKLDKALEGLRTIAL